MENYDNWKLDTPDNHLKKHSMCGHCEKWIWIGELIRITPYGDMHDDCFLPFCEGYFGTYDPVVAGDE